MAEVSSISWVCFSYNVELDPVCQITVLNGIRSVMVKIGGCFCFNQSRFQTNQQMWDPLIYLYQKMQKIDLSTFFQNFLTVQKKVLN